MTSQLALLLSHEAWLAALSGLLGVAVTLIVQALRARRGVFSYQVVHSRIGISSDDPVYGSVRATWNDNPVHNLSFSVIELTNESMRDYEDIVVRVFSRNTDLLSESAGIRDSTTSIGYTDEYKHEIAVPADMEPTEKQSATFFSRRDFMIPTLNRGQVVRFSMLNAVHAEGAPSIWLDIQHPGVICKFKEPRELILGVPRSRAVIVGSLFGLIAVLLIVNVVENPILAGLLSFFVGWLVLLPGIGLVRLFRKFREVVAG